MNSPYRQISISSRETILSTMVLMSIFAEFYCLSKFFYTKLLRKALTTHPWIPQRVAAIYTPVVTRQRVSSKIWSRMLCGMLCPCVWDLLVIPKICSTTSSILWNVPAVVTIRNDIIDMSSLTHWLIYIGVRLDSTCWNVSPYPIQNVEPKHLICTQSHRLGLHHNPHNKDD